MLHLCSRQRHKRRFSRLRRRPHPRFLQPNNFRVIFLKSSLVNSDFPGILRRLASMLYESLLLLAVVFLAGFVFVSLTHGDSSGPVRLAFQLYLTGVVAAYFIWFWMHGGQTLAMKTWHLRLVGITGQPVSLHQALLRFLVAVPGMLSGISVLWALFDRDRQFLHDRLAKTKIILIADS